MSQNSPRLLQDTLAYEQQGQAANWGHEGLTLFRQLEESQGIVMAMTHLAYTEIECGAYDRVVLLGEETYALEQHMGNLHPWTSLYADTSTHLCKSL